MLARPAGSISLVLLLQEGPSVVHTEFLVAPRTLRLAIVKQGAPPRWALLNATPLAAGTAGARAWATGTSVRVCECRSGANSYRFTIVVKWQVSKGAPPSVKQIEARYWYQSHLARKG
jgi:hypothetical protein